MNTNRLFIYPVTELVTNYITTSYMYIHVHRPTYTTNSSTNTIYTNSIITINPTSSSNTSTCSIRMLLQKLIKYNILLN